MKPIKLLIKGLQSFEEEQEIDFQKLSEHGLFGIFGPTGSGKSTILDAITLAIYGDIVRIKGSQADRLEHLVNMNCNEMRVDFTFELGSHVFQIIREMKLKKTERVFSSKKQYLLKDGEIIADKDTQIKSEIDNYIGLSMDDFTRSVVLPQGKFSEFLKLSGTDRRDMLERLFGLQKYGKQMLDKIRKKLAIYQDNISAIDNQILGKGNFSEDELEKNKEILNNLKSEKIQVENFLKTKTINNENLKPENIANRETARIIKDSFEQQNNIIEANKFYALEMKEREKELDSKKDFFEWLVFKFHGLSSNHSQDWTLVLFWIININFFYSYLNIETNIWTLALKIPISLILILLIGCMIFKISEDNEKKRWLTTIPITMVCYFFYGYLVEKDWLLSEYSKNLFSVAFCIESSHYFSK